MTLFKSSAVVAIILVIGRIFGAAREILLAQRLGPTGALADYILATNIYMPIGGLLGGVASALMLRRTARVQSVASVLLPASLVLFVVPAVGGAAGLLTSGSIHLAFAASLPFFALYGICSGLLLVKGRVVASMVFSILPPLCGCLGLLLPDSQVLLGVASGNLLGSVLMATLVYQKTFWPRLRMKWSPTRLAVKEAVAIASISAINIGSPIIDRLFANNLGAANLVLLNLSAIVFLGVTGTMGMALGNTVVGRETTGGSRYRSRILLPVPVFCSVILVWLAPQLAKFLAEGPMFDSGDLRTLTRLLEVYGLAAASAVIGQVLIRVWNLQALARSMFVMATSLFLLNIVANVSLIPKFGISGIALSTLMVQIVQLAALGHLAQRRGLAGAILLLTLLGGLYVFGR